MAQIRIEREQQRKVKEEEEQKAAKARRDKGKNKILQLLLLMHGNIFYINELRAYILNVSRILQLVSVSFRSP